MADNTNNEMSEDENDLIKSYFLQSFEYKDNLRFLSRHHGISISKSTLQRRLKSYDISRKHAKSGLPDHCIFEAKSSLV